LKTLRLTRIAAALLACAGVAAAFAQVQLAKPAIVEELGPPPAWAYVVDPPASASDAAKKSPDNGPRHVSGSIAAFTPTQIGDLYAAVDWHPDAHPVMPEVVAHGRKPDIFACAYCHLPNGEGRPENASLAGLPAAYIVRQMADFRAVRRKASEPRQGPVSYMVSLASKTNDDEVRAAADYFSSLKPKPWIRVVETKTVSKTRAAGWMLVPAPGREPVGERIIETAENLEQTELRDDDSGFVAYVPVGSIARGKVLAAAGAGKTIPCSLCHGSDLRGKNDVPWIAGRSPSYIVRQLYDIRSGTRNGTNTALMKPTVAKLTLEDIVSIAAYTSSPGSRNRPESAA
jgi:cytochrome c553